MHPPLVLLEQLIREEAGRSRTAYRRAATYTTLLHRPPQRHPGGPQRLLDNRAESLEMPRRKKRTFCCGAGGAHMWVEESGGQRINHARTEEAAQTGADIIA
jgi:hypothetical protein